MKYSVLYFYLIASTALCGMQDTQHHPDAQPETWQLETRLPKELSPVEVIAKIKKHYQNDAHNGSVCINRNLYLHLKDSRANIIEKFKDEKWFSEDKLRKPL
jgi:hypothetical protein